MHSNDNYSSILLTGSIFPGALYGMLTDALSPITMWDTTSVVASFKSKEITRGESTTLNAHTDSTYASAWWQIVGGDTIADSLTNVVVSPTQTTRYVACLKICDTCCWYSYDTITVYVRDQECDMKFPTLLPLGAKFRALNTTEPYSVNIFNSFGELVYADELYQGEWSPQVDGVYFVEAICSDGVLKRSKFIVL